MNLLIDGQPLFGHPGGIYRYVRCLARYMAGDSDIRATIWLNQIIQRPENKTQLPVTYSRYPYKVIRRLMRPNLLYELPIDSFRGSAYDIFHGTNFTIQPIRKRRSVVTIHDLAFMRDPSSTSRKIYRHHSKWVPYSAKVADRIITVSEHAKRDIIDLLNVPEKKISVTPLAADARFQPSSAETIHNTLQKYHLPHRYFLFVGTLEPRKNLIGLLRAYAMLKQTYHTETKLVVVGAKGWTYDPIFQFVKDGNLTEDVVFPGFIPDDDLPAVYSGSIAFVFPSWYEGFGIPLLEAMGTGIPVIASNCSSIPEVVQDAGILIPPDRPEPWAEAMHELETDNRLRVEYGFRSMKRAAEFSWKQTYEKTKQAYYQVLG